MSTSTLAVVLSGSLLLASFGPAVYAVDMAAGAAAAEGVAGEHAAQEAVSSTVKDKATEMVKDKAKEAAEEKLHGMAPGADAAPHK